MQDLTVVGVESGSLLVADDDGERYRIAVDETLTSSVRRARAEASGGEKPKLSPREIQAHIRSGMSAEDVASLTGAPLEDVQRFEGPIIAERDHVITSALSVPVRTKAEVDPVGEDATFGVVIRERLASLGASGERWASWKEVEGGWIVKLSFTADEIDHDARWTYDQRKHSLAPQNSEAVTLSQQGEIVGALIPRLRAVTPETPAPEKDDETRFDSDAFTFTEPAEDDESGADTAPYLEPVSYGKTNVSANNSIAISAIKRSDDGPKDMHQTADLLEALRKRRGEREAAADDDADSDLHVVDVPIDDFDELDDREPVGSPAGQPAGHAQADHPAGSAASGRGGKKGRASMPSWDEIVFGAKSDDDHLA